MTRSESTRDPKAVLAVLLIIAALAFAGCWAGAARADSDDVLRGTTRAINVVWDTSGSMVDDNGPAWGSARYSVEVMSAMLGEYSTMSIYDVARPDETKANGLPLVFDGATSAAAERVGEIPHFSELSCSGTNYDNVEAAARNLLSSDADQKWLIVFTDGRFTGVGDLTESLAGYAAQGVNVVYVTIGSASDALKPQSAGPIANGTVLYYDLGTVSLNDVNTSGEVAVYEAHAGSGEIVGTLQKVVNLASGRHELVDYSYDAATGTLTFDSPVSLRDLVVFVQGEGASIESAESSAGDLDAGKNLAVVRYDRDLELAGLPFDRSNQGQVATFNDSASLAPGGYTVRLKNVDPSKCNIYYEPNIKVELVLSDSDGSFTFDGSRMLYAGDYTVDFRLADAVTGDPIDGALFGLSDEYVEVGGTRLPLDGGTVHLEGAQCDIELGAKILGDVTIMKRFSNVTISPFPLHGFMPDVLGMDQAGAQAACDAEGVSVTFQVGDPAGPDATPGTVYETDPRPGDPVLRSDTATALVYADHPMVSVPNLSGMDRAEAEQALDVVGLAMGEYGVGDPSQSDENKYTVYEWDPTGEVVMGSTVNVTVYGMPVHPLSVQIEGPDRVSLLDLSSAGYTAEVTQLGNPLDQAVFDEADVSAVSDFPTLDWQATRGASSTIRIQADAKPFPRSLVSIPGIRTLLVLFHGDCDLKATVSYVNEDGNAVSGEGAKAIGFEIPLSPLDIAFLAAFAALLVFVAIRLIIRATAQRMGTITVSRLARFFTNENYLVENGEPATYPLAYARKEHGLRGSVPHFTKYHQVGSIGRFTVEGLSFGPFSLEADRRGARCVFDAAHPRPTCGDWFDCSDRKLAEWSGLIPRNGSVTFVFRAPDYLGDFIEVTVTLSHSYPK